ncbi:MULTISPECIES: glycosyltransferase family 4 protein [Providencia]|uniref:WfaQ n=1 Tax=Providencia alcalifaciens TaxID=126385 RepID=A0A346CLQ0_9GAMM|nr:glycosyltransferase family 4 protein [Providencia sp. PROV212]AXL96524.1 WfaQ [Providencia alcalifaciens]
MKILFILADITFVGGIERVIANLSNALSKHNIEVEILSLYKSNSHCYFDIDKKIKISFLNESLHYDGKPGSLKRLLKHLTNIKKLRNYLKENSFDFIIANSFPTAFQLYFSKKESNWIAYEHVHFNYYNYLVKKIRNLIYKKFDKIVVLTTKDEKKFSQIFNNVITIHNPLSFESSSVSNLENHTLIAVGRLEKQKGFDILIDAFSKINNKNWRLNIFGEGNEHKKLLQKINSLGASNIYLMGKSNDIKREMLYSSIFILSSRFEGFPMVLGEAMECGLPCISFDCPNGPSDLIQHDHNGILVKNGCTDSLARNIEMLINNQKKINYLAENAKSSVKELSICNITNQWMTMLHQVKK